MYKTSLPKYRPVLLIQHRECSFARTAAKHVS